MLRAKLHCAATELELTIKHHDGRRGHHPALKAAGESISRKAILTSFASSLVRYVTVFAVKIRPTQWAHPSQVSTCLSLPRM